MVDLDEEKQVAQLRSETDAIRQCALLVGTFSQCAFPGPLSCFLVSRTRKQFLQNSGCRRVTLRPRGRDGSEAARRHIAHVHAAKVHAATTKSSCDDHPSLALLQTNHLVFCLLAAVNGFATSVHAMSESADKTQAVLQGWISEHSSFSFSFSFLSHRCPCRCFRFSGLDRSLGNPSFPPVTIRPQTQARTGHESQASSV